jgi:hypothetical protein
MTERFNDRLEVLAGASAVNCGSFGWDEPGTAVIECANAAAEAGNPYWLYGRVRGIDSILYKGIARNVNGEIFLVIGDSDVHGGGGWWPKPRVVAFKCIGNMGRVESETVFDCKNRTEI